jgi:hypothetical protein
MQDTEREVGGVLVLGGMRKGYSLINDVTIAIAPKPMLYIPISSRTLAN